MSRTRKTRTFRPTVVALEDRCLLATVAAPIVIDPPSPVGSLPIVVRSVGTTTGPTASPLASATTSTFGSEAALVKYLINDALTRYQNLFGQPIYWWYYPLGIEDRVMPR